MGKRKKSRESTKSSGERPNTNRSVLKSVISAVIFVIDWATPEETALL